VAAARVQARPPVRPPVRLIAFHLGGLRGRLRLPVSVFGARKCTQGRAERQRGQPWARLAHAAAQNESVVNNFISLFCIWRDNLYAAIDPARQRRPRQRLRPLGPSVGRAGRSLSVALLLAGHRSSWRRPGERAPDRRCGRQNNNNNNHAHRRWLAARSKPAPRRPESERQP